MNTYRIKRYFLKKLLTIFKSLINKYAKGPEFYDPAHFEFSKEFEANWKIIRDEYLNLEKAGTIPRIQDVFREQAQLTEGDNWKSGILLFYGHEFIDNLNKCPMTAEIIRKYPQITTVFFSVLAPGKTLKAHEGPYMGVLRYHLGLIIPDEKACYITVNGIKRHWKEGHSLILDDNYIHTASNLSQLPRVVLFIDFVRPLTFPLNIINKFFMTILSRSYFVKNVLKESKNRQGEKFKKRLIEF